MKRVLSLVALLAASSVSYGQCSNGSCGAGARPSGQQFYYVQPAAQPQAALAWPAAEGWYQHQSGFLEKWEAGQRTRVVLTSDPNYKDALAEFSKVKTTAKASCDTATCAGPNCNVGGQCSNVCGQCAATSKRIEALEKRVEDLTVLHKQTLEQLQALVKTMPKERPAVVSYTAP